MERAKSLALFPFHHAFSRVALVELFLFTFPYQEDEVVFDSLRCFDLRGHALDRKKVSHGRSGHVSLLLDK